MTSERNAKGMLAKLATLSCRMWRGSAVHLHVRGVGVVMLMCVSVIACGHRSLDKVALQAKVSDTLMDAAGPSNGSPFDGAGKTRNIEQAITTPLAGTPQNSAVMGAQAVRDVSHNGDSKRTAPSLDGIRTDALLSLEPSPFVDNAPPSDGLRPATHQDAAPPATAHDMASDESLASRFHWFFLLGFVALLAISGLALALMFDNRRHRRLRVALHDEPVAVADDDPHQDDVMPVPTQKSVEGEFPFVSEDDALPMMPEPVFTLVAEGGALPESAHGDLGTIPSARLDWRYSPGKFDAPEQWAVDSPIDFLPVSRPEQAQQNAEALPVEPGESAASPVKSVQWVESTVSIDNEEQAAEEASTTQSDVEQALESIADDDPLARLFDQLEFGAMRESSNVPALLVERDSDLPQVIRTTTEAVPPQVLQAWESTLRQAIADAHSLTLPSLLISTLLLRADDANSRDAEALYEEAEEWVDLSKTADHERRAAWEARRVDIDLRRARRKTRAARLLWLRAMQAHYAPELAQGEPLVLLAWIDVLMFWAQCQFGDAALARYTEAEAVCLRVGEVAMHADVAQRRRAEVLRQRATIEQGGARLHSLDTAQALVDGLHERDPSAANALAVAITTLARGNVLPPAQAKEAYSHALMQAFMAEGDPRWREQALQCRLAVQWAYENLPGMGAQSDVAIKLAERLEAMRVKDPDTVHRMAQTYLRSADFARACELCEHAWRSGHATAALLSTWQDACRQWANVSSQPGQLVARQQTMRQLSIASAMR